MKNVFRAMLSMTSLAVISCIFAASTVTAYGKELVGVFRTLAGHAKRIVLHAFEVVAQADSAVRDAVVLIVAAKSFVQRIVRRERLQLTSTWRLVPSV